MKSIQAPGAVVMIRPHHFCSNPETRDDNAFQTLSNRSVDATSDAALAEFDQAVADLREAGIRVHVFDDLGTETPDSVFPNNWFSTHAGGHIAIYPMFAQNRRLERRGDVIEMLKAEYRVQDVIDCRSFFASIRSFTDTDSPRNSWALLQLVQPLRW